ncbi:MAG: acyl carrier protein [Candidatus Omnitrophica bacterium]|nr:acyl carrier protein [Candidatus Omnitrophota bacterium]
MHEEVYEKIKDILASALGRDPEEICPEASLTRDLGAESIDFIDIIFRLEKSFDIKIPSGELFPGNILNQEAYVKEGRVTPEGLAMLKAKLPYLDIETFSSDPEVSKLAEYFTVQMIVSYIQDRLAKEVKA